MLLLRSLSLTPNYGLFDSREELANTVFHLPSSVNFLECWGQRDSEVTSVLCGKRVLSLFFVGNTCDGIRIPSFIVTLIDGVAVDWIFQFPLPWFRSLQKDCSFQPGWTQEWPLTCPVKRRQRRWCHFWADVLLTSIWCSASLPVHQEWQNGDRYLDPPLRMCAFR